MMTQEERKFCDWIVRHDAPRARTIQDWRRIHDRLNGLLEAVVERYMAADWPTGPNPPDLCYLNGLCAFSHEVVALRSKIAGLAAELTRTAEDI